MSISVQLWSCVDRAVDTVTEPCKVGSLHIPAAAAVGFLSRPAGAILFGHLGDTRGRGFCLLLSILVMGIPTVLIGCLPTYTQAGLASPILLAVLRLVQGLAMGGEFGTHQATLCTPCTPDTTTCLPGGTAYTIHM